jgi:hypothetical protein
MRNITFATAVAMTTLACGRDFVFGQPAPIGAGGATGAASSTTVGGLGGAGGIAVSSSVVSSSVAETASAVQSSSSSGVDCTELVKVFKLAFAKAAACDPCQGSDPCAKGDIIHDSCGCSVRSNGDTAAVLAVEAAYNNWVASGCGPYACGGACPGSEATFGCQSPNGDCAGACGVM